MGAVARWSIRAFVAVGFIVVFAGSAEAAVDEGSVTVVLDTVPDSADDQSFIGCGPLGCGDFSLDDDTDATLPDRVVALGLPPAEYTITAHPADGYELTAITCTTAETVDLAQRELVVDLEPNENTTCTFEISALPASVTVVLDTVPDSAEDQSFIGCGPLGCGDFSLDDDTDATLPDRVVALGLPPAEYTITAHPADGYELTAITCTTAETVDLAQRELVVDLEPNENTTCTFEISALPASVTVVLDTVPDSAEDQSFSGCGPLGCGDFSLDDDTDATLPDRVVALGLPPAEYTITAHPADGYELTAITCTTAETVDLAQRELVVDLEPNENTTCTFEISALPEPIVFVHGLNGGPGDWETMRGWLVADGFPADRIFSFAYDGSIFSGSSNADHATELADYIEDVVIAHTGPTEIDLVHHSMGGLSTRWCVKFGRCSGIIDDFVSIAGINHGTLVAGPCWVWPISPHCVEMLPFSDFLNQLNAGDETPGDADYTTFWSNCDGQVLPRSSTWLNGADNRETSCVGHNELRVDRPTYESMRSVLVDD